MVARALAICYVEVLGDAAAQAGPMVAAVGDLAGENGTDAQRRET